MAKDFQQSQNDLADLHMDTSSEWVAGGAKNKKALNKAYEQIFDLCKNSEKVKRRIGIYKTKIDFTNKVATLPVDFDTINIVSLFDFATDSDIVGMSSGRYYDFEVRGAEGSKKMYIEGLETSLWISYIPVRVDLVNNGDRYSLPDELFPCIADFGYYWYNRMIRDDIGAANALQLAQSVLDTKLSTLG